ncbi:MAG TPA: hypothetical protein VF071_08310 [Candidatus Limnocylindria bacterium]
MTVPRRERSGPPPLHPLGLAAVPVLFLFAENQVQQVTLDALWRPLGLAVLLAAALLVTGAALFWDWQRGGLLAALVVGLFYSFGHAWNLVGAQLDDPIWLADMYLVAGVIGAVVIWRGGRWVRPANAFLNLAVAVLLLFNAGRVAEFALGSASPIGDARLSPQAGLDASGPRPDIIYVVLDRYAGAPTLEHQYGFDNGPFLDELENRGFGVAREAWANYFKTALSLVSSLSMDFLDTGRFNATGPAAFDPIHRALRDHLPVPVTLTSLGYEYVHIASYWEPTATNADADIVVRYQDITEFEAAVRSTTLLMLLEAPQPPDLDPETIHFPTLARETTLFAFDAVEDAASRPGPTFIFAHILVPHPPYVFDADGSLPTDEELRQRSEQERYLRQLEWTNGRVLQMVDRLLDVPEGERPVIILQADEGPFPDGYRLGGADFPWLEATADEIAHKFAILNALHLPGVEPAKSGLTDSTSPVNNFRIVLNAYFDAGLPLVPDRVYLSRDHAHPYEFVEYRRPAGD